MVAASFRGIVALAVVVVGAEAARAAGTATVRGGEAVNVRRGPTLDSPAFLWLPKGSSVTVEKVVDGWALVILASGQQGYIKSALLDIPPGVGTASAATPTTFVPTATAVLAPTSAPVPSDVHDLQNGADTDPQRAASLERELAQMRERLAAIESAVATPANIGPTPAEGAPLTERERRSDDPTLAPGAFLPTAAAGPELDEIGPSLALAGVGALIGFLLGAVYGRRQERNRRSRVRF